MDVDSRVGRLVQRMAGSAAFARVGPKVVPPLDRLLHRLTGGRVLLSAALLPSLMLVTTGARSGQRREVPLACLPEDGGSFLVVGSNFGRQSHPAWTANLLAHPDATVVHRGRTLAVTATLLDEAGKKAVWPALTRMWPTYDRYTDRSGRDLRVFRLTPTP